MNALPDKSAAVPEDAVGLAERPSLVRRLPVMGLLLALIAADLLMFALLGLGVIGLSPKITPERLPVHIDGLILSVTGFIIFAAASGLYNPQRAFEVRRTTPLIVNTMIVVGFILFAAFYIGQVPLTFSRLAFLVLFFGGITALVTARIILAAIIAYMLAGGYASERLLLVAFRDDFSRFMGAVAVGSANRMQVTSVLRPDDPHAEEYLRGHIKALDVESIVFLTRPGEDIETNCLFVAAQRSPLSCYIALPHGDFPGEILKALDEGSHILLQTSREAISGWGALQKRALDILASFMGLLLSSPLLLVTMLAIKLESRGPTIFRQTRYGYNNKPFTIYKLRSMRSEPTQGNVETQTGNNDPRVTRVGRLIRRLKIDELPQLFNVLKGDMSLVGPRAHATRTDLEGLRLEDHETRYLTRHNVRPGLTSWAIVNGCTGAMDTVEKLRETVDYDLHYIRHWSVWFDLTILAMTMVMLVAERSIFSRLRRKRGK